MSHVIGDVLQALKVQTSKPMQQWHPILKFLHWLMAMLLIAMISLGFVMTCMVDTAEKTGDYNAKLLGLSIFEAYQMHKSIGAFIFLLLILRIVVRFFSTPVYHKNLSTFEAKISRAVHGLLYFLVLLLPISGWFLASSSILGIPTIIFGMFQLPHLINPDVTSEWIWSWVHFLGGIALTCLTISHIAAALKHHYWNKDEVLVSMLPRLGKFEKRLPNG